MTYLERVKVARTEREALLVIAEALDDLRRDKDAEPSWDQPWHSGPGFDVSAPRRPASLPEAPALEPPPLTDEQVRNWIETHYLTAADSVTPDVIAQVRRDIIAGQKAQARLVEEPDLYTVAATEGGGLEISFAPPDEETAERRRWFAEHALRLPEALGEDLPDNKSWIEQYVLGGPMWLYHGNRDLVLSYSDDVKSAMIADVANVSQRAAHEMSIDILKAPMQSGTEGSANKLGEAWVGGKKNG